MREPSYSTIVDSLAKADVPVRQLSVGGNVAVTLAAGRVIAMAFTPDDQNLLWSHPQLCDPKLVHDHPEALAGGFGGDRLWFSPELHYHWDGKPEWDTFANNKPPAATDPGAYSFVDANPGSIALHAEGLLPVHGTDRFVGFEVDRTIRMVEPPVPKSDPLMSGVEYVGIETSHVLKILDGTRAGLIDLWHVLQVPAGAVLIVPLKQSSQLEQKTPLSYGLPGGWIDKADHILWRFEGQARAKFGLPATAVTGRAVVFRKLEPGRWCMIVREFPVEHGARYGDHPYGIPRTDQVLQAWDGFGFGEMEFHSPVLDAELGPRQLQESDRIWAFGGSPQAMTALAERLLAVDVGYVFVD